MPSCPNEHSHHSQSTRSISQQRSLEIQNKQLEEQLKDKQDSLTLQTKILATHTPHHHNDTHLTCIDQLLARQNQVRSCLTQQLIEKQLQIEQAKQMSEIISNYEKRISDLRAVLINKEGEISAVSYQFFREQITRRENLQAINSETLQKMALARYAKQKRKLQVEIEALQFTLTQLQSTKPTKRRVDRNQKEQTVKKQPVFKINGEHRQHKSETQYLTAFSTSRQQDRLTDRVVKMIEQETDKYNQQTQLAELLKLELQTVEAQSTLNLQKYTKAQEQRSKMLAKYHQSVVGQNKVQQQSNQLSFIKELQQEISHTNSELFSHRDTNIIAKPTESTKSAKPTPSSLKQRRPRHLKQN